MVNTVKNNSLNTVNDNFAVVDFSASWCGPCKMLAPVFHELADEKDGKDAFYSVDVDENRTLAEQFNIYSVPTLVVLKDGKEVARSTGFRPKEALNSWIESVR